MRTGNPEFIPVPYKLDFDFWLGQATMRTQNQIIYL
jgi:hypothetical protein